MGAQEELDADQKGTRGAKVPRRRIEANQQNPFHPAVPRQVDRLTSRLRGELDGRLKAAVHVEGDGLVLMRDLPRPPDPTEAERVTKPDAGRLALGGRPAQSVEAVREGHVLPSRDGQITEIVTE